MTTVRDELKRRNRLMKQVIGLGLAMTAMLVALFRRDLDTVHLFAWVLVGAIVTGTMGYLCGSSRFACPNCGKGLRKIPRELLPKVVSELNSAEGLTACPHCGASFDVPMPK
jgi:predicted RNA-binding Zn-ribbon protein involved in translation (DUF1610 family)